MRIGTWNLDAKWSREHGERLERLDCDVRLLTEVNPGVTLTGYDLHATPGVMARGARRRLAGTRSRRRSTSWS